MSLTMLPELREGPYDNLPPNWGDWEAWPVEAKIQWHEDRINYEGPVYDLLEQSGLMACFEREEILERLVQIRALRAQVESVLQMMKDSPFQQILSDLQGCMNLVRQYNNERSSILKRSMRRASMQTTDREKVRLSDLREMIVADLQNAMDYEQQMQEICITSGVTAKPFLIVKEFLDANPSLDVSG